MKPVLQAVVLLGLATPTFSAAPEIDFDGRNKTSENTLSFLNEMPAAPVIPLANPATKPPEMVRIMERLNENGEFVEVIPEIKVNEAGKKVSTYTIQPNWWVRWKVSCPGNGSWSKRITYSWDAAAGGHNHSNPPPPPLLFSNSQSTQFPPNTEWAYTPSPINFPVMQGNNKPYYYWMWYPEFATRLVEWPEAYGACVSSREEWTYVKEDGLIALIDSPNSGYVLTGMLPQHPYNHQAMPAAITALRKIAFEYKQQFPTALPLRYNDFSLPWGGLFDIGPRPGHPEWQFWNKPHSTHRRGWEADVEYENVPKENFAKLNEIFIAAGARVVDEPDKAHWHLDFTPKTDKYYEEVPRCY